MNKREEKPTGKHAGKHTEKPTGKHAGKPTEEPTGKHALAEYPVIVGNILMPFVIYYLVYMGAYIVMATLAGMFVRNASAGLIRSLSGYEATVNAMIGGIAMLIGIVPLLPQCRREDGFRMKRTDRGMINNARFSAATTLFYVIITLVFAVSVSLTINILFIQLQLTESSEAYRQTANNQYGVIFPIGLFLYGIVSPLAEEVVFRGMVYRRLRQYFHVPVAMVLSALLFGLYHGNLVQAVYGFIMGMFMAYLYEMFGGIFYAFLFHATANVAVYTVTGKQGLYEMLITPYIGIVLGGISVALLFIMRKFGKTEN